MKRLNDRAAETALKTAAQEVQQALADTAQSTEENRTATTNAVLDVQREITGFRDKQTALTLLLSLGADVPAPMYVETYSAFSQGGYPNNIKSTDQAREWTFNVTGAAGATVLTYVAAGSDPIAQVGTQGWLAGLPHDDGRIWTYTVLGYDATAGTITLTSPLRSAVTNKPLRNVHWHGNHYSPTGYRALAHHLWRTQRQHTQRELYISRFASTDTSGPWVLAGGLTTGGYLSDGTTLKGLYYNNTLGQYAGTGAAYISSGQGSKFAWLAFDTAGQGVDYAVQLSGARGWLEAGVSLDAGAAQVTVELDGAVVQTVTLKPGYSVIRQDYLGAATGTLKIRAVGSTPTKLRLSTTTWWLRAGEAAPQLIDWSKRVLLAFDSWGVFVPAVAPEAFKNELIALATAAGYTPDIVNVSRGGVTSRYGLAWMTKWLQQYQPEYVLTNYGVNDINNISGTVDGSGQTTYNPDGSVLTLGPVSMTEWRQNMLGIHSAVLNAGAQSIQLLLSGSASEGQHLTRGLWNESIAQGISAVAAAAASTTAIIDLLKAGGGTGAGYAGKSERYQPNSGAREGYVNQTMVNLTGAWHEVWKNAAGTVIAGLRWDNEWRAGSFEATGTNSADGFKTPNAALVEGGNVLILQQRSGKTLNEFRVSVPLRVQGNVGFYNAAPIARPAVTGSRGGNAALQSLIAALAALGLVTDSSTA